MSGNGRTIPIGAAELRAIRERESVLEQTLARLTGVDTATVERIENGETPLSHARTRPDPAMGEDPRRQPRPASRAETPQEGAGGGSP